MMSITLEDAGLSLPANNTRGGGLRLKQQNNGTILSVSRFKIKAPIARKPLRSDYSVLRNSKLPPRKNYIVLAIEAFFD